MKNKLSIITVTVVFYYRMCIVDSLPSILCVDDEKNVLDGLSRILFEHFEVETATSGAEGLELIKSNNFTVIISDMRMPEMNGAEFLSKALALAPNSTRILLTGQSDMDSAIAAVNDGNIFRFLLKPCPEEKLIANINEGVRLNQLIKAEKELLEKTLRGSIKVLTEVLSMVAPTAFSRSTYIKDYVSHMASATNQKGIWEFEIAAMLSQVGAIILPPELLKKAFSTVPLSEDERETMKSIPMAGAKLVDTIPRLGNIALMIESQFGTDRDLESLTGKVQAGARMLRIASMLDKIILRENTEVLEACAVLTDIYSSPNDRVFIDSLATYQSKKSNTIIRDVAIGDMKKGMILAQDVFTKNGGIVLCKGQTLTSPLINRLINFSKGSGIVEPISVGIKKK